MGQLKGVSESRPFLNVGGAQPSLCAMVKLTYGRANGDKVSPPDTLTIGAQERRTPREKSAPTQICRKPPTAPSRWYSLRQSKLCPELG